MTRGETDLILIPCCKAKDGIARISERKAVADFVGQDTYNLLTEGRRLAFQRPGVRRGDITVSPSDRPLHRTLV